MAQNYRPAPGPVTPQKYGVPVGPNYMANGEQKGWIYVPQTDRYYIDKKALEEQYKSQGLIEEPPAEPSLADTLIPIGATVGTAALAQEGAKALPGLLGFGGEAAGTAAASGASAAGGAGSIATPQILGATNIGAAAPAAPGAFSLGGIGAAGNAYLPALGLIGGADLIMNKRTGARGIAQGALSGAAMGSYFGPPGAVVGGVAGGLIGVGNTLLDRPTTRDIQKDHTEDLRAVSPENQNWQNYVSGMRAQHDAAPSDPTKPFAGKYGTFEEYKAGGLESGDLTGVHGNLKTFGPDWAGLSFDDQKKVTQGIIDAGLYNSKKGEVEITDPTKAKQIYQQLIGGVIPQPRGGLI